MLINGTEWRLVPVEPTEDMKTAGAPLIGQYREAGKRYAEAAYRAMLAAAPTPPAQDQGDDCDDVDAILRIVGLDPERCRTEGGALNVGRTRTLWEDVVSPAAQPAAASPDFPHYEMAFICRVLEGDRPEKVDLDTALGMARSVRVALLKERAAQAPAASAEPV